MPKSNALLGEAVLRLLNSWCGWCFSVFSVLRPRLLEIIKVMKLKKKIFSLRLLTSYISITKKGLYSFVLYSTDNFILAITINCNDIFESFVCANKYHTIL